MTQVCSTEFVFHALLNPELALVNSILQNGIRPLSGHCAYSRRNVQ
jgi:hypothetical protein